MNMNNVVKKRVLSFERGIDIINRVKSEPEPNFIWHGIPVGSKGLITGVAKTGKTTLAENLAISLSVGKKEFLGFELDGIPKKVLFINLEESYKLHGRRNAKQISNLTDIERQAFGENYMCAPDGFPEFLITDEDWSMVRDCIIDSKAEVVFIDSLTHMFEGEIEKSSSAKKFIEKFRETLKGLNVTIIVVHHNTKGNNGPMTQDNIAGSRIILQEFEFAIGLANIPTSKGGNYMCMLYNKHIEKDDTTATIYKFNKDGWVENLGKANKFDLYKDNYDGRTSTINSDFIYNYVKSQTSQGSQIISTAKLITEFVENDTQIMSKDTLHKSLNKLKRDGKISKESQGMYKLNEGGNDGQAV